MLDSSGSPVFLHATVHVDGLGNQECISTMSAAMIFPAVSFLYPSIFSPPSDLDFSSRPCSPPLSRQAAHLTGECV